MTQLHCPGCGAALGPAVLAHHTGTTRDFHGCDRRCEPCGVGFSNGRAPTTIYRDPLRNVPAEVRAGAMDVLERCLNERSRGSKRARFGFSTSEDAVSWTVFAWLGRHAPGGLADLGRRLFGGGCPAPSVLLWGVPLVPDAGGEVRARIVAVLDALGEAPAARSEPDVVLDYGPHGLVFVEVKYGSRNDERPATELYKFDRYLSPDAFARPDLARASRLYELARNWRVGVGVAGARPFRLVNLGAASLFAPPAKATLDTFEASFSTAGDRAFVRLTWDTFLADTRAATGPFPPWLAEWLRGRGLSG